MAHHGKTYDEAKKRYDREREYSPAEAIALIKQLARVKFNESVEVHVRTGLNVRHADEQLRGTMALPNGLGKDVKVAVFAQGDKAREAEEAGADVVGAEDLAQRIQDGFDDFDVAIATPDLMPVVGRLGRILGPAGKMPNPKVGTVTMDVAQAVEESKAGKVEYRTDRNAIVHLVIGKRDFDDRKLLENYAAVIDELIRAKPSAAKGRYIRTVTVGHDHGARRQGRPHPHARHRRGASSRVDWLAQRARPRPPAILVSPEQAEPRELEPVPVPAFDARRSERAFRISERTYEPRPEISSRRGDRRPDPVLRRRVRGGLPRHLGGTGGRASRPAARVRNPVPRRQELADRAGRRRGGRLGVEGVADRARLRWRSCPGTPRSPPRR